MLPIRHVSFGESIHLEEVREGGREGGRKEGRGLPPYVLAKTRFSSTIF
jgi:hypothetical protein